MYGFVTFAIWGGVYALLPRATGKYPYNLAMGIHFWLSAIGVAIYVAALSAAGTIQGLDWFRGLTFIQSVEDAAPYWLWRSVGRLADVRRPSRLRFQCLDNDLRSVLRRACRSGDGAGMNRSLAISGGSTLIYVGLAILMGVLPVIWLSKAPPTPGLKPLTPLEARGRDIYVSEGCFDCHTQQGRPLSADKPFGRPSAPGDYAYQTTESLGSERNGPDLSNIGTRQSSSIWQYIHLYEPRAVVPQSIMPAFPWLFGVVDKLPPERKRCHCRRSSRQAVPSSPATTARRWWPICCR